MHRSSAILIGKLYREKGGGTRGTLSLMSTLWPLRISILITSFILSSASRFRYIKPIDRMITRDSAGWSLRNFWWAKRADSMQESNPDLDSVSQSEISTKIDGNFSDLSKRLILVSRILAQIKESLNVWADNRFQNTLFVNAILHFYWISVLKLIL